MTPFLTVDSLQIRYSGPDGKISHALNGLSLQLSEGTLLGVLGESGCGKSTLAKALLRTLPKNAHLTSGSIQFEGKDLNRLSDREMNEIRGARISMISQEPALALNPVIKVGTQIAEVLRAHRGWSGRQCRSAAEALLERVNLRSASRRMYDAYPHQLSGGQQQRVVITQAIACNPSLIIADEPTASLDPATEAEILELFQQLKAERKTSFLLITHNPTILDGLADRIAVLYAGRIVEDASSVRIFREPMHPYTKGLLACLPPAIDERPRGYRLPAIAGSSPATDRLPAGCSFSPRCADRFEPCESLGPTKVKTADEHTVECFLYDR
jgi:oligopeptide/dipeptide ABC transporter ATP-binding protein